MKTAFILPKMAFIKNLLFHESLLGGLLMVKLWIYNYPSVLTYVLGAQRNCLIETVPLSTHNICFGWVIRKLIFNYTLQM